jgi:hypothetical protein
MPGTVNNSDIVDVLSSIRRLVADDEPERQNTVDTQSTKARADLQKLASQLLLTQSLRTDFGEAATAATDPTTEDTASTARLGKTLTNAVEAEIEDNIMPFFTGEAKSTESQVAPYEDQEAEATRSSDADLSSVVVGKGRVANSANLANDDNTLQEYVLVEGVLRELIGKLMREELEGEFGERISRNIRKLVRGEIHRAMDSIDLD